MRVKGWRFWGMGVLGGRVSSPFSLSYWFVLDVDGFVWGQLEE